MANVGLVSTSQYHHLPSAPILTVPIPNLPVSVAEIKKERERMMKSPKVRKKTAREKEKRIGRLKKARIPSETIRDREDS
jgi:hypothetical protein